MLEHSKTSKDTVHTEERHPQTLSVLQLNCRKMESALDTAIDEFDEVDILLLQEPPSAWSHRDWQPFPSIPGSSNPHTTTFVRANLAFSFEEIPTSHNPAGDITIIKHRDTGLFLINVYNPCKAQSSLVFLNDWLHKQKAISAIIGGDFNSHHTSWESTREADVSGKSLFKLAETHDLIIQNIRDMPTRRHHTGSTSVIDLTFTKGNVRLSEWAIAYDREVGSDHTPILLSVLIGEQEHLFKRHNAPPRHNWSKANWPLFQSILSDLDGELIMKPDTPAGIDEQVKCIETRLLSAVSSAVPILKHSKYSKPWWTDALRDLRRSFQRSSRRLTRLDSSAPEFEEALSAFKRLRNRYHRELKKAKKKHWRKVVEEAGKRNVWHIYNRLVGKERNHKIPPLSADSNPDVVASTPAEKATMFRDTFFPNFRHSSPAAAGRNEYPPHSFPHVTKQELHRVISSLPVKSATGGDHISNTMAQHLWLACPAALLHLCNSILRVGYHPTAWKEARIHAIPKPGRASYLDPKAYRPISLLSCMSKILERVMATRLSYLLEANGSLPDEHHGFRTNRNTVGAFQALLGNIREAWASKEKVSALFIDFKGAFDRVPHEKVLGRLRHMGIPEYLIGWTASFLHGRAARISVEGHLSAIFYMDIGLPQGSPMSSILFIVFNSSLLVLIKELGAFTAGFADDISAWVRGPSLEHNSRCLTAVGSGMVEWSSDNGQLLESSKTIAIHFTREQRPLVDQPWLILDGTTVKPARSGRYLGLVLDNKLGWSAHCKSRVGLAVTIGLGTRLLYKRCQGVSMNRLREIFVGKLWSILTYGIEVWGDNLPLQQLSQLSGCYRKELIKLTGAMSTTPLHSLEIEMRLPSFHEYVRLRQEISTLEDNRILFAPWEDRLPNVEFIIPPTKDEAYLTASSQMGKFDICYFPDGSVMEERSAYGIYVATKCQSWEHGARLEDDTSIFICEKEGLLRSLELAVMHDLNTAIFSDCRSLTQFAQKLQERRGIHMEERLVAISRLLSRRKSTISIFWIPGHWGIHGNEEADRIAKNMLHSQEIVPMEYSRHNMAALLKSKLSRSILQTPRLRSHRPTQPDDPEPIYSCSDRSRQQIALWLRTGHSPLQAHMHRVGRADDPFCPHCPSTPEGRRHFLLECPAFETERTQYITPIIDPHGVLRSRSDPHLVDFLLRSSNIGAVVDFCMATGRFKRQRS